MRARAGRQLAACEFALWCSALCERYYLEESILRRKYGYVIPELSRTFSEYLLLPNLTTEECTPDSVDLSTPLVRFRKGEQPRYRLNLPLVSAIMQSVSDDGMAIALAREGGLSFIFGSQSIADQAAMVRRVKKYKAGFVSSDSNI